MGAAGQAIIEFLLLTVVFMLLLAGIAKQMPITMKEATPYLGGQVEARLQTGVGFSQTSGQGRWSAPLKPKGGLHDP